MEFHALASEKAHPDAVVLFFFSALGLFKLCWGCSHEGKRGEEIRGQRMGSWIRRGWICGFGARRSSVLGSQNTYFRRVSDFWTENQGAQKTPNPTTTDPTPHSRHTEDSVLLRADFREGDEDSNFSVFRVRRFTESPGPLH